MKNYGDITKILGRDVPPVEVIIGGSPCQDLSIAGKRAGLSGERSGLFMEQICVIKEMRQVDKRAGRTNELIRPRFMVWENVPGVFSSNGGEDFRAVLEETARVADENAVIPRPPHGKWTNAGAIVADGWSIAWRVLDAQFWGVPQRRRRIALIADFGGQSAPEILFERKGLSRNTNESGAERKGTTADSKSGIDTANKAGGITSPAAYMLKIRSGCEGGGKPGTGYPCVMVPIYTVHGTRIDCADTEENIGIKCLTPWDGQSSRIYDASGTWHTLYAGEKAGQQRDAVLDFGRIADRIYINADKSVTLQAQGGGGGAKTGLYCFTDKIVVRRLTPLECERLQGFPDGWTDIGDYIDGKGKRKKTTDSARYKALGNSIAIPPWTWVLSRLNSCCEEHTMASLFDGIGGFPLIWERLNGTGSCLWASEIEEFPISVTKKQFGGAKK